MLTPLISESDTVSTKLLQIILFQIIDPKKVSFINYFENSFGDTCIFIHVDYQQAGLLACLTDSHQD